MRKLAVFVLGLAIAGPLQSACAQGWPNKPIRLVVNFAPGGGTDVIARIYAPRLGSALGQPVLVENVAGADGRIGLEQVAHSAPDGYTLLHSPGNNVIVAPHLYKMDVDIERDLRPVAPVARTKILLVVRPALPVKTVQELVDYGRANPGKLNFGSAGIGTLPHIAAELFMRVAHFKATHVPYKGVGPVLTALLSNQIDFTFDSGVAIPAIKSGKLRLLAVAGATRSPLFPDAPTMAQAGFEVDGSIAQVVYAPAGTPRAIVTRLHDEIDRIVQSPEVVAALGKIGAEPATSASVEEFAAEQKRTRERFGEIIREADIHVD